MTANVSPQLIKQLRELRPKGEDTPDEFIADILVACDLDLTRSFEMLEERLSRSSWEVEKGKKKKPEIKPNNSRRYPVSVHASRDRRYGAPNGRNDLSRAAQQSNQFHGKAAGPQSKPATAPQPPKAAEKPVPQTRPVDWVAPPPCNKWANGRPQLIVETPKVESKVLPSAHNPEVTIQPVADTSADVDGAADESSVQPSNLSDGSFESSSHTEDTVPSDSLHESMEEPKTKQAEITEQPSEIEEHVSEEEATAVASLQDLKIDGTLETQVEEVPTQQPEMSTPDAEDGQIKAQQASPANHANSWYPSYGPGYNQYGPQFAAHQQRFARQDQSNSSSGSKFVPADLPPNAHEDGRNPIHSKTPMNPRMQHQQGQGYGWQGLMGNSYGMMAPNMYSMTPQQMQMMMSMQTYGVGMPYGYAQQQNFTAASSKANQYQQSGAKGVYNGSYAQANSSAYSNAAAAFASHGGAFVPANGYPATYGQGNAAGYQNLTGYMGGYGAVPPRGEDYSKRTANEAYSEGSAYGLVYSGMGYEQQPPQGYSGSRGVASGASASQSQENGGSYYWNPSYFQNGESVTSQTQ